MENVWSPYFLFEVQIKIKELLWYSKEVELPSLAQNAR